MPSCGPSNRRPIRRRSSTGPRGRRLGRRAQKLVPDGRVSPKRSLAFARLLRAVSRAEAHGGRAEDLLNVVDGRTLRKLMSFARAEVEEPTLPGRVDEFLASQRLITDAGAIGGIKRALGTR